MTGVYVGVLPPLFLGSQGSSMQSGQSGVVGLLGDGIGRFLETYDRYAGQRQTTGEKETGPEGPTLRHRSCLLIRGMFHFPVATPYAARIRANGRDFKVFAYEKETERRRLLSWQPKAAEVVNRAVDDPDSLGTNPIISGHSEGGLSVYLLGAIAMGADWNGLREEIPDVAWWSMEKRRRLREKLVEEKAIFIAIGTPLRGVHMNMVGRGLNRLIAEPLSPRLFSNMEPANLDGLYRKVGVPPARAIHGVIAGLVDATLVGGGIASMAVNAMAMGALRTACLLVDRPGPNDGIVPIASALIGEGVDQVILNLNHLALVERPAAADGLLAQAMRVEEVMKAKT